MIVTNKDCNQTRVVEQTRGFDQQHGNRTNRHRRHRNKGEKDDDGDAADDEES